MRQLISSLFQVSQLKRRRSSSRRRKSCNRRRGSTRTLTLVSLVTQVSLFFFSAISGSPVLVVIWMMTLLQQQQHQQQSWLLVLLVIFGNVGFFSSQSSSLLLVEATTPTTAEGSGKSETLDAAITAATTTTTTTVSRPPRFQDLIRQFPTTYAYYLSHHPLATECLTAACMALLGDYIAQRLESRGSGNVGSSGNNSIMKNGLNGCTRNVGSSGNNSIMKNGLNGCTNSTAVGGHGGSPTLKMTVGTTSTTSTAVGTMTTDTTTPSTSVRGFVKHKNTKSVSVSSLSIDRKRSLTFFGKGLGEGVMWSFWYHQSDRIITRFMSTLVDSQWIPTGDGSPLFILIRTFLALVTDLFIACPIIYSLWDIPLPALVRGTPLRMIPRQIRIKLPEMMWASIKLWMPANIIIYNSPLRYRVLLMSTADVFWQAIVSTIATREIGIEHDSPTSSSSMEQQSMIKAKFDPDTTLEEGIALLPVGGHSMEMDKDEEDDESSPPSGTGAATTTTTTSSSSSYLSSVSSFMTTGGGFFSRHAKKTRKM